VLASRRLRRGLLAASALVVVLGGAVAAVASTRAGTSTAPVRGPQHVLAIEVRWAGCDSTPDAKDCYQSSPGDLQKLLFANDRWSLRTFIRTASGGRASVDGRVVTGVSLPIRRACGTASYDEAARLAIARVQRRIDVGRYPYVIVYIPNPERRCDGTSVADFEPKPEPGRLPGTAITPRVAWVNEAGDDLYGQRLATTAHEFGHLIGLEHSGTVVRGPGGLGAPGCDCEHRVEYGDAMSAMGTGWGIYSAPQRAALGWLPVRDVDRTGTYRIRPATARSGDRLLSIRRPGGEAILAELRSTAPFDAGEPLSRADVRAHAIPPSLVLYQDRGADDLAMPRIVVEHKAEPGYPVLEPGESWHDSKTGLSIRLRGGFHHPAYVQVAYRDA
jgi:hypothetical protein